MNTFGFNVTKRLTRIPPCANPRSNECRNQCARLALIGVVMLAMTTGCWQPPRMQRSELEQGYILVLEGIDFDAWQMAGTYQGLRDAGIGCAVDVPDWGYRNVVNGGNRNLTDLQNNRRLAEQFAGQIVAYRKEYPGRPVDIIGYSGGGGLAILTAEVLPPGTTLDRIILLGAALSPDYDLTTALGRCERGIVNFYSAADSLVLGAGTKLYGTIDRKKTVSAGHVGFSPPPPPGEGKSDRKTASQPAIYAKLTQIAWTPQMRRLGHDGGHFGWVARRWTADIVAPYLRPSQTAQNRPKDGQNVAPQSAR